MPRPQNPDRIDRSPIADNTGAGRRHARRYNDPKQRILELVERYLKRHTPERRPSGSERRNWSEFLRRRRSSRHAPSPRERRGVLRIKRLEEIARKLMNPPQMT